jgi:toxoflavin biosynthesis protein ToxC
VRDGITWAGTYAGQVVSADGDVVDLGAPVPSLCATEVGLVAGTYAGDLVEVGTGRTGAAHAGSVKSLAATPGGFLSASTDRTVAVGTLTDRVTLWEHGNLINAVACLGGTVAASASRDHTVKIGGLDGSARQTLIGPDESVKCVALLGTPDAPTVLAGSYDFGLYVWDVDWSDSAATLRSARLVAEFRQGLSCMVALDDRRVAVAGWDGRILIVTADGVERELTVAGLFEEAR